MEYIIAAVTLSALPLVGGAAGICLALMFNFHHSSHRH